MNLCPPDCPCLLPPPMHSFMETWVPLCVTMCVCPIHPACVPTHCLECVHVSVHEFISPTAHAWSNSRHSFMETWVPLFLTVCVCPSHPGGGPTPCLECVHASVHEFMSI